MTEYITDEANLLHDIKELLTEIRDQHDGRVRKEPDVTVKVSRELLAELAEWSEPVQVMVTQVGGEYDMIFRRPGILVELTGDRAPTPWTRVVQLGDEETISAVPQCCMHIRLTAAEMGA